MDERQHNACRVLFQRRMTYLIWYSADQDGFVRDHTGRLVTSADLEALIAQARALNITLERIEPARYNFDAIRSWCDRPDPVIVDFQAFLNAWNFLDDLVRSTSVTEESWTSLNRGADACYDKLFWGNNLPAVTPAGEHFDPAWRPHELATIRDVPRSGIERLEKELEFTTPG